jgi:hypothetical protein
MRQNFAPSLVSIQAENFLSAIAATPSATLLRTVPSSRIDAQRIEKASDYPIRSS